MKIFRIIARLNVGGPARQVVLLTRNLQRGNFQSVLVAGTVPDGEEDMSYFAAENGVQPLFIPELSRELSLKDIVSLYKIFREMRRHKPDIVETHTAKAGTLGRLSAFFYKWLTPATLVGRPRKVKIVHIFHGHVFHSYYGPTKTRIFLTIEKILARFATDRIVVVSPQQFEEIHKRFGVGRRDQFVIIPLGIDLAKFANGNEKRDILRNEIGAATDEIVVGFTGRLTEIKNVGLLVDVAAKSRAAEDAANVRFVIIGDGDLRQQLEERSNVSGLDQNIVFLGNRNDVADLLPGMDIIALTSKNEGTPLSLIEAMSTGIPFVSTAVGGVVDLAGDILEELRGFRVCERGLLVDGIEAKDFLNALIYLAKDEKLRKRLKRDGAAFAHSRYSSDRLTDDMVSLYEELLGVRDGRSDIA